MSRLKACSYLIDCDSFIEIINFQCQGVKMGQILLQCFSLALLEIYQNANVFFGALLIIKCIQNASTNYLKLAMEWVGNIVNHHKLTFFQAVEKARHMMGFGAPNKSIDAQMTQGGPMGQLSRHTSQCVLVV